MSLISSSASSQEIPILDKNDRVSLKKGQSFKAPKEGQFLSKEAMAKLISDYNAKIKTLEEKLKNQDSQAKAKLDAEKQRRAADKEACDKNLGDQKQTCELQKSILTKAVDRTSEACERKFWEKPIYPFIGGLLVCGGGIAAGAVLK